MCIFLATWISHSDSALSHQASLTALTGTSFLYLISFCDSCASEGVWPLPAGFCTLAQSTVWVGFLIVHVCERRGCLSAPPLSYPSTIYYSVCVDYDSLVYQRTKMEKGINWLHQNQLLINAISAIVCVSRKEQTILSPVNCWNLLLLQVKRESRDHATLSDLYLNNIIPRFAQISEDSGRLFKKVTLTHSRMISN